MKSNLIIIFLCLYFFTNYNLNAKENNNMKLEINFYPSSGGSAIYKILLLENFISVSNLELENNKNSVYKQKFSKKEIKEIKNIILKVKRNINVDTEIILDSWRIELIINGIKYYNESGVNIKSLPINIKKLVNLLMIDSTVKIKLYGFS